MKIRLLKHVRNAEPIDDRFQFRPGEEVDFPTAKAKHLIAKGYAVDLTPKKTTKK